MSDIDFNAMSREELREYVKTHPRSEVAFHAYMDRIQSIPGIEIT